MEKIVSRDNQTIKEYVKLRDSKSAREKQELFVIESTKLVLEALNAGMVFEKVFVTRPSFEKNYEVLQRLFDRTKTHTQTTKLYEIADSLEQKMTATANSQGIFAVCKKLDKQNNLSTIKKESKYIFLSSLQDTGNVGTIIRTAEAIGLGGVIVSKNTCDIYSLKVLRASMGSVFRLPIYQSEDTCADLFALGKEFSTYAAVVSETALSVSDISFPTGSIVVVGNEGNGLENDVVESCQQGVTICMKGNAESLNAGMAAGILMWEMMKK